MQPETVDIAISYLFNYSKYDVIKNNCYMSQIFTIGMQSNDLCILVRVVHVRVVWCHVVANRSIISVTSHAIYRAIELAKELGPGKDIVINMSGRGDKDMPQIAKIMGVEVN